MRISQRARSVAPFYAMEFGKRAAALEAELGIPVLDSVAVSLWGAIGAAGADAAPLAAQGRVFALPW